MRTLAQLELIQLFGAQMATLIEEHSTHLTFPEDETLLVPDTYVKVLPFIISGSVKIYREDEEGNEIFLYYVEKMQTCAMTALACLGGDKSKIKAVCEVETQLWAIPMESVETWMAEQLPFRRFILRTCGQKFDELFKAVDNLAFKKLDERLLQYIREYCKTNSVRYISKTHQELANEMNTSREVVSRLLKQMERQGHVRLARSRISLITPNEGEGENRLEEAV